VGWNYAFNFPTYRNFLYSIGIERVQMINKKISFSTSFGFSIMTVNNFTPGQMSVPFSIFVQPFHLIAGEKKIKFETGLSLSYFDYDITNNQNTFIYPISAYKSFYGSLFVGARFVSLRKRFTIHIGYQPKLDLRSGYLRTKAFEIGTTFRFSR